MTGSFTGGSLLVAWQLKGKHVLVVGGGEVAYGRIDSALAADAFVQIISPRDGLHDGVKHMIEVSDRISYYDRPFGGPEDLVGVDMVLTAIDDVETSRAICAMCRDLRIPVNAADIPPSCDFYFGSQIRDGPLQIMISTNGQSPKLANLIRKRIERSLPEGAGEAITKVGMLRERLKERAPGVGGAVGRRRMKWMVDLCTSWDMVDMALLDDKMIQRLLDDGWEKDRVPTIQEVGGMCRRWLPHFHLSDALCSPLFAFFAGAACATGWFLARSHR